MGPVLTIAGNDPFAGIVAVGPMRMASQRIPATARMTVRRVMKEILGVSALLKGTPAGSAVVAPGKSLLAVSQQAGSVLVRKL